MPPRSGPRLLAALWLCACGSDGANDRQIGEPATAVEGGVALPVEPLMPEPDGGSTLAPEAGALALDGGGAEMALLADENTVFFGPQNPVIYLNDRPSDVYVDGYLLALASNREIELRGLISAGAYAAPVAPPSAVELERKAWVEAARKVGFRGLPDPLVGVEGQTLTRPSSGQIADTTRLGSAGTDLIVREARMATPERPLLIVCGGSITTLADAYLSDPSIAERVVVSWVAGYSSAEVNDYNGLSDRWATEIVLRKFRTFLFPVERDLPATPKARMTAEFPDNELRKLLLTGGNFREDADGDGAAAIAIMLHRYVRRYLRRSIDSGVSLKGDPNGNIWIMAEGDSEAAGNEFFRALSRAFKGG